MEALTELLQTLWQLVVVLWTLIGQSLYVIIQWALLLTWLAWALLAIQWKKVWPTLAAGAWAPFVLLVLLAALVWANLQPMPASLFGIPNVPNFLWQLGIVSTIAVATLLAGWFQGVLRWAPPEFDLDPPAENGGHVHH